MPKGPGIIDGVVQPGYDHLGRYYDAEHGLDDGRRLRRGTRDAVRRRDARPEGDWELPPRSRPDDIASFDRRHRFSGSRRRSDVRTMRYDEDDPDATYGPEQHVAALRQQQRAVDKYYRRKRLYDRFRERHPQYRSFRDQELEAEPIFNYWLEWSGQHSDLVYQDPDVEAPDDPRLIRKDRGDYWVLGPRQRMTRAELQGQTSGGRTASETMTGATRDQQHKSALLAINMHNRRHWAGRGGL
jgi:hypothetical protein